MGAKEKCLVSFNHKIMKWKNDHQSERLNHNVKQQIDKLKFIELQ